MIRNKEIARSKNGRRVAITNQWSNGLFETVICVDDRGELIAGMRTAQHKTLKGAETWAKKQVEM